MTKLPAKALLDGSKLPKTTTGEMKEALGNVRDYLSELLGEDSSDKEGVRRNLGIDLTELSGRIDAKADRDVVQGKADRAELMQKADVETVEALRSEFSERVFPVGTIMAFAGLRVPTGFLMCDGSPVSRSDYPDLFEVIGTLYGEGDGHLTFNVPNLNDRFLQGSTSAGVVREAGLPNIQGEWKPTWGWVEGATCTGALSAVNAMAAGGSGLSYTVGYGICLNASQSSPVYGKSDTVQPPAVTVCFCIRAVK